MAIKLNSVRICSMAVLRIIAGLIGAACLVYLIYRRAVAGERDKQQRAEIQTIFDGRK